MNEGHDGRLLGCKSGGIGGKWTGESGLGHVRSNDGPHR